MSIYRAGLYAGKVAIVTGGGTGIGRATAEELASLGCKVVIASRKEENIVETAKLLSPSGKYVIPKVCNIRKEDQVKTLISSTLDEFGKIDYLVNNGGGQFGAPFRDITPKGFNAVIDTNLFGTVNMIREAYEQWMKNNGGSIVTITIDCLERGIPGFSHSGAARAAIDNLTKSLACEWAEHGIRLNCVAPAGNILTKRAKEIFANTTILERHRDETPMKRFGTPEEVASCVSFLLSPGASYLTGLTLRIDGGFTCQGRMAYEVPEHSNSPSYSWDYTPNED